jgi:hypothetical protein
MTPWLPSQRQTVTRAQGRWHAEMNVEHGPRMSSLAQALVHRLRTRPKKELGALLESEFVLCECPESRL